MPNNFGVYNDDLSNPRIKDFETCYGPNNTPPYPVTSVNGQTGDITVSAELPEHLVKYDTLAPIETTTPINADTLQGYAANYFATGAEVSALSAVVDSNTDDITANAQNITRIRRTFPRYSLIFLHCNLV